MDMTYGKKIELFLANGSAESLVIGELSNWNGKAIKIPRSEVNSCDREDLQGVGIYFLLGFDEEGQKAVYIGEAEDVKKRLVQHLGDNKKDETTMFWNKAVAFVSPELNKAFARYLEHNICCIAKKAGHYKVTTKTTGKNTKLKEADAASMQEFIDNVKLLLNALGYPFLNFAPKSTSTTTYYFCKSAKASAKGFISDAGFTVVEGSSVAVDMVPSMPKNYAELRKQLEENQIIQEGKFLRAYEFSSPSAASSVVLGQSSSGKKDWKNAEGISLKDLEV